MMKRSAPGDPGDATPELKRSRRSTANPSLKDRPALTLVFEHDDCGGHDTGGAHQEAADRLTHVHRAIARVDGVVFTSDFEPASVAALQRVHSDGLIEAVRSVDEGYSSGCHTAPRPLSPVLTERLFPESTPFGMTIVSAGTWRATTRAAGAVIAAIDKSVDAAKAEEPPVTAFCLVRPPGHHACVDGFDSVAGGCGFCVFNAVAVGAPHAIEQSL